MIFKSDRNQVDTYIFNWNGANLWEPSGNLAGRIGFAVTTTHLNSGTNHVVIVAGGENTFEVLTRVEIFDTNTQRMVNSFFRPMPIEAYI